MPARLLYSAAIACIASDERIAVLDGNVERVMARYLALEVPVRQAKETLRAKLQDQVPERAGDFAQAMMDLGATICAPRTALCMLCPLRAGCLATRTGNPTAYPVRPKKAVRPVRYGHAFVLHDSNGRLFLRQRPAKGLLARMTEVPGSEWLGAAGEPAFPVAGRWRKHGRVVHVFTHFRLELDVWSIKVEDASALAEGWWADPRALDREALPSLFRKVVAQAGVG